MKIIDLLNKIANEEEVPKYVQYYNMLEDKTDIMMVCKENIFYKLDQLEIQLNSRVESVEEKKILEKLPNIKFENGKFYLPVGNKHNYIIREVDKVFLDKINEIIDFLKSKGDE